jgi:1-acyl-sn-glycerol-3-phosphate acyltransferase
MVRRLRFLPPPPDRNSANPFARHSPFLLGAFRLYLHWYFWRAFHGVGLSRTGLPAMHEGRPLIVYTNHPSWWDPALLLLALPKLFPGRLAFGPMERRALGRYRLVERMGIFGIDPGTAHGARAFLHVADIGLAKPNALLCITAEGAFTDARVRPVRLRPGLAHLARRSPHAVFLPLALEYAFWNESRPEALLRFGSPVDVSGPSAGVQDRLERALAHSMDALAVESIARDPGLFQPLLRGTAGVGGIYDLYRRTGALLHGRWFDASHEPEPR